MWGIKPILFNINIRREYFISIKSRRKEFLK